MTDTAEILYFSPDPIKRQYFRRITLHIVAPLCAMTLLTCLLGSFWWMLPFAAALLVSGSLSGYPWYWRKKPLLTITDTTIKGPLLAATGWSPLTIKNLPSSPIMTSHSPARWQRWCGLHFNAVKIVSCTTNQHHRIHFDISVLSDEDQRTVFQTLKQRYDAVMSPTQ